MAVTIGSICVGYGGLETAIAQHLNIRHTWHAEFDPAASKVLAAHWPGVPNYGDVTKVDWAAVAPVKVFAGGVPCQGYSHAGKRKGSDDDRDLWPVRKFEDDGVTSRRGALDAIRALMPPLVVIENVPGLLTSRGGQDFATILADLDELGYTVSWTTVGACRVGACHHRHRVFIAATLVEVRAPLSDPVAHREGSGWGPAQFVLFGDAEAVKWPAAGFVAGGTAWELPADTCGNSGPALPGSVARDHKGANIRNDDSCLHGALLPTPNARDGGARGTPSPEHAARRAADPMRSLNLEDAIALLPTPTATPYGNNQSLSAGAAIRPSLEGIARLLPTPTVADSRGTRNATAGRAAGGSENWSAGWTLSDVVYAGQVQSLLPTPVAGDADRVSATYSRGNPTLLGSLLPTPRASDGEKGGPNQRGSSGDVMLPAAVQPERFGKYAAAVARHEAAFGLPAPDPTEPGRNGKPRLAPEFPEWMQALPRGFLTDVVDRAAALRIAGNGVHWPAAAYALSLLPTFRAAVAVLQVSEAVAV